MLGKAPPPLTSFLQQFLFLRSSPSGLPLPLLLSWELASSLDVFSSHLERISKRTWGTYRPTFPVSREEPQHPSPHPQQTHQKEKRTNESAIVSSTARTPAVASPPTEAV